jgi:starch synthase (maltosyl-transferring)
MAQPVTPRLDPVPSGLVIEDVRPRIDDGRFDAKGIAGDDIAVEADAFADGHHVLRVELCHRSAGKRGWSVEPMASIGNDRWRGAFTPMLIGRYEYCVRACVDHFASWLRDLRARLADGQDVTVELLVGAEQVQRAADRAKGANSKKLAAVAADLAAGVIPDLDALRDGIAGLVARYEESAATTSATYGIRVERVRARFSTWYELFPRSASNRPKTHGTFVDVVERLDYLADLGIDVLYLPPIHPIGTTARKGRNGATKAKRGDVGSPWAIGSPDGGHTALHPQLGTLADLHSLMAAAADRGIEIALDLAFQCSPDHPWVTEHPEWFAHRPDGSIRYAENPPKRYEDIYPLDFSTAHWRDLWDALRDVVEFWIGHGVRIFRVDNPHTKPFGFWEWLIPTVQSESGDVLFLAEAFTRPKVMKRLAKVGFSQSYTYFTWRTEKWELEQYLTELTATDVVDYFRPNFWPNTPDILTEQLQNGNRTTFMVRAVLAGTLAANYGIYGPVFELLERVPRHIGSEEYRNGEKYELRRFDLTDKSSIAPFLSHLNAIRKQQLALQDNRSLRFHGVDNDQLLAYSKTAAGVARAPGAAVGGTTESPMLVVVNLDTVHKQSGWIDLDLAAIGVDATEPYVAHDLLSDSRYEWKGNRNFVILDPLTAPAHIFRIEPATGTPR